MNDNTPKTKIQSRPLLPNVILGAGKQSEHVLQLMRWQGIPTQNILLFDDIYPSKTEGALGNKIKGSISNGIDFILKNKLPAIIAIGSNNSALRYTLFRLLQASNICLPSAVHNKTIIFPKVIIAPNTLIMPGCIISPGVKIGALATLFAHVTIEHDCQVGENVTFGPGVVLSGEVQIGSHVFLGAGVTVSPNVKIGKFCVIGAGSVVVKSIESGKIAFGRPAQVVRDIGPHDDAPSEETLRRALTGFHTKSLKTKNNPK